MREKRTLIRFGVLLVIFLAVGAAFYTGLTDNAQPVKVGDMAPDFRLESIDGESIRLSDYRGKAVFVNFWATWCDPCKVEMPYMEDAYQAQEGEQFEILAVNIAQSQLEASSFAKRYELSFPIVLDRDRSVVNLYGVGGLPASFFINAEGRVVDHHVGPLNEQMIANFISKMTEGEK